MEKILSITKLSLVGLIALLSCNIASAKQKNQTVDIQVKNETENPIYVTVRQEKTHLTSLKKGQKSEHSTSIKTSLSREGSVEIPEMGKASQKESASGSFDRKDLNESNSESKWDWTPFVEAGEAKVGPGKTHSTAVDTSNPIYYLTVRTEKEVLMVNVAKSTKTGTFNVVHNDYPNEILDDGCEVKLHTDKDEFIDGMKHPGGALRDNAGSFGKNGGVVLTLNKLTNGSTPHNEKDSVLIKWKDLYLTEGAFDIAWFEPEKKTWYDKNLYEWQVIRVSTLGSSTTLRAGDRVKFKSVSKNGYYLSLGDNNVLKLTTKGDVFVIAPSKD